MTFLELYKNQQGYELESCIHIISGQICDSRCADLCRGQGEIRVKIITLRCDSLCPRKVDRYTRVPQLQW